MMSHQNTHIDQDYEMDYQYVTSRYSTMAGSPACCRFIFSACHFSNHFFILPRLFSLPTFTVAIILTSDPGTDRAKHVNSKKLECSEYGTPKTK